MKKVLLILLLFISTHICGQNYSQKFNKLLDRIEFFDSYGRMVGYAKYNSILGQLEYYDAYGSLLKTEKYNELLNRKEIHDPYGRQLLKKHVPQL